MDLDLVSHHRRMFAYDDWANRAVLNSLRAADPPPRTLGWLAHILGARRVWLNRLEGIPAPSPVWPDLDLDGVAALREDVERSWTRYLAALTHETLASSISYTNQRGETYTTGVADILAHVASHSHYHRGQIATALGAAGRTPPMTDFILYVRSNPGA